MAKFEIEKSSNGNYYYHFRATGNYEIVLRGAQYTSKALCNSDIAAVKANAANDLRYERKTASNGQHFFNLKDASGDIVGTSEMYVNTTNRDNGIEVVKAQAPTAPIYDLS